MKSAAKKGKIRILAVAVTLVIALLAGILTMFLYVPSTLLEGINNDVRFRISYFDFENYFFKNGETTMPFRLKEPENPEPGKKYPLAVFLHGGGSHGMNNIKQMCAFYIKNIEKYGEDCYILMPQVSDDTRGWDEDMIKTLEKCMDTYLIPNYQIDTQRIYLSGSSMGGYGSIQALVGDPERYAAAMFDSGAIPCNENEEDILIDYNVLKDVPMLISHGRLDDVVPIESILRFTDNLHAAGAQDVSLKIYEDRGHETTDLFYYTKENWEWLFAQHR